MSADSTMQPINIARAALTHQLTERSGQWLIPARPARYDHVTELENVAPVMPRGHAEKGVHTEQQAQRSLRMLAAHLAERIDRVGASLAADFAVVYGEASLVLHCGLHHG